MKNFGKILLAFISVFANFFFIDLICEGLSVASAFTNFVSFISIPILGIVDYYIIKIIKL